MLATASRSINGRTRQSAFGAAGNFIVHTNNVPPKKGAKLRDFNFNNSQPVRFTPSGKIQPSKSESYKAFGSGKRPTSKTKITKNHNIEMRMINQDIMPIHKAIHALTYRVGGPYGQSREGTAKSAHDIHEGDFVVLLNAQNSQGIVIHCHEQEYLCVDRRGLITLFSADDVILRFPRFIDDKLAKQSRPEWINFEDDRLNEPFDPKVFEKRAQICKHLNVLQRQVETYLPRLLPAFEDLFLSGVGQDSLQDENDIRTSEVATMLRNHPFYPKNGEIDMDTEGADMDEQGEGLEEVEEGPEGMDDVEEVPMTANQQHAHRKGQMSHIDLIRENVSNQLANSPAILVATHQLLFENSHIFLVDTLRHSETQTFSIRPTVERKALIQVQSWVQSALEDLSRNNKNGNNPVRSFAEKAKKVMELRQEHSKIISADNPGMPRAIEFDSGPAWTPDDIVIIQALLACGGHPYRGGVRDSLTIFISYILKECGLGLNLPTISMGKSLDQLSKLTIMMPQMMSIDFLKKLGFVAPWENLPNLSKEFRQLIKKDYSTTEVAMVDQDEAIRSDFNLPVYVIDDATAFELDDGVSIEDTLEKNQYWIHVSVADPTTSIDINDSIAKQAQRRHNSIYSPDAHWSMLPPSITRQYGLRVNDKEKGNSFAKALQFSALLDFKNGKVLQYNVKLVRIKDVRVVNYDQVDVLLTGSNKQTSEESMTEDVKLLHQAAIALEKRRRLVGGALIAPGSGARISLYPLPLPMSPIWQLTDDYAPPTPIYTGFPYIGHRVLTAAEAGLGPKYTLSHGLVSEMMILANRVASQWISDRKMPALFAVQSSPAKESDQQILYDLRDKDGVIPYQKLLRSGVLFSPGATSVQQAEHFSMGLRTALALNSKDQDALSKSGYARVTSPLRRYPDLLNHWQIKQVLRTGSNATPLFNKEELLDLIPRQDRMNRWFKLSERNSSRFYFVLKLVRGIQSRRGEIQILTKEKEEVDAILDSTHEALVTIAHVRVRKDVGEAMIRVHLTDLGVTAEMKWDPLNTVAPLGGTQFQVKITDVFLAGPTTFIYVERV